MMNMKKVAIATVLAFLVSTLAVPFASAAPQGQGQGQPGSSISIPVTGTGSGGTFAGTFELRRFVQRDGAVWASGMLTGTVTSATGVVGTIVRNVLLPVVIGEATCDILHLDLGPLSLNLLGLQIDLSRIVLDITAQAGPGNLLGNLLCAVANLLNDPSGLTRLLNSILDILG